MNFDYSKLRGRIREYYGTEASFAANLGIGRVSLSKRLNNELDFSRIEILRTRDLLNIPTEEIGDYFFKEKVQVGEPYNSDQTA